MKSPSHIIPIFLVMAAVMAAGSPAAGQSGEDKALDKSKVFFQKGVASFSAHDYKGALESFLASYKLHPHALLKLNIGTCLYALKKYAEAGNTLEELLLESGGDIEPKMKQQTLGILGKTVEKVGMIGISANIEGVEIRVDGKSFGKTPLKRVIYVDPGTHRIVAVPADGDWKKEDVAVAAGEKKKISFTFDKLVQEPAEANTVEKEPGAAAGTKPVPVEAKRKKIGRGYFYSFLTLGASALVVGAVLGGLTLEKAGEIDDLDAQCIASGCDFDLSSHQDYELQRKDMYDEAMLRGNLSTGFLAAGGALMVVSIVLSYFTFKGKSRVDTKAQAARPELVMSGGGAALRIDF